MTETFNEPGSDGRVTDDAYGRAFMGGDTIVFFDRVRAPWWLNAAMVTAGAIGVVAAASTGDATGIVTAGAIAVMTTTMASMLAMLRTAVTTSQVHIQYGLFGPKIAVAEIASVEVVDYEPTRWGGWGIRRGLLGGTAYSIPGKGGKAVRITTTSGKVVEVTSQQPAALRSAILEVQAATAQSGSLEAVRDRV
ncbi:MAG TPA: hypothetical protein VGF99_09855, partial [Myxococcota bacterium]